MSSAVVNDRHRAAVAVAEKIRAAPGVVGASDTVEARAQSGAVFCVYRLYKAEKDAREHP
jgi:hypothetical protein